jgi:hypothetical protein
MTQQAYINKILEPVVKPWLERGDSFTLEEDCDSGHGPGKNNIVRKWKEANKLQFYFNCYSSPDLSPIETAGNQQSSTLRSFYIGMKLTPENWLLKAGREFLKASLTVVLILCHSPEINASEHAWPWIRRQLTKQFTPSCDEKECEEQWVTEWDALPIEVINRWVMQVPVVRRMIKHRGNNDFHG